jgi:transposase-like protein
MDQTYDEALREKAVARVVIGEPVLKVSREMSIPRSTLRGWVDQFEEAGGLVVSGSEAAIQHRRERLIEGYFDITELAQDLLREGLAAVDMSDVKVRDLQSIAVISGIATQRGQDLAEGRWTEGNDPTRPVIVQVVYADPPTARDKQQALVEGQAIESTARVVEQIPVVWEDRPRPNA